MKTYNQFAGVTRARQLNPLLWSGRVLKEPVRNEILEVCHDFLDRLGFKPEEMEDIRLLGNQANYTYQYSSDIDITIMMDRGMKLRKEDVRRLGLAATRLVYEISPNIQGIPANIFISSGNLGSLRPCQQSVFSLKKNDFLMGPTNAEESHANFITAKTNYLCELIECALDDETPKSFDRVLRLSNYLKRYFKRSNKSASATFGLQSMVWTVLSNSYYIQSLKEKARQLKRDVERLHSAPSLLSTNDFRMILRKDGDQTQVPQSIIRWNKRILMGEDPKVFLDRVGSLTANM
jgi:hypothetical protein